MDNTERAGLKEQLLAMAAGRGDGIDLDSKNRWVVEGLRNPPDFFRQLNTIIPEDSILYFEGCDTAKEVAEFFQKNRAANAIPVVRDTIFPVPETFHVSMTLGFINGFTDLLSRRATPECFNHVKAYRNETLIFAFHDAFDGSDCLFSDLVPEENIRAFASSLGSKHRLEPNVNKRDPEQLRRILWALENSHKLRINWPWWKKALFFWKR
jgi:hypothetical protein